MGHPEVQDACAHEGALWAELFNHHDQKEEVQLRQTHLGGLCHDAKIAPQRQLQAAAKGVPVHHGIKKIFPKDVAGRIRLTIKHGRSAL